MTLDLTPALIFFLAVFIVAAVLPMGARSNLTQFRTVP